MRECERRFLLLDDISGRAVAAVNAKCAARRPVPLQRISRRFWRRIRRTGDSAAAFTILAWLCNAWLDRRQIGPEMPSAPMIWPVKSITGTATQRTSGLNSPSSKAMPLRRISAISRSSTRNVGDRLLGRWFQVDAFKETLELIGAKRGQDDLAERSAMRRSHHADAVGQLKRAGPAGAGDHHDRVAHAHREMAAFAGFPRQVLQHRRGDIDHLDLVERAGGERKQRPADAIALGVAAPGACSPATPSSWRDGRWWSCAGRPACSVPQGQCLRGDARSPRGSQRRGRATARRRAAGLRPRRRYWARSRLHQLRDRRPCADWRGFSLASAWCALSISGLHGGAGLYQANTCKGIGSAAVAETGQHTTIAIDVQYYGK